MAAARAVLGVALGLLVVAGSLGPSRLGPWARVLASTGESAASLGSPSDPFLVTRVYLDGQRVILPVPAVIAGGSAMVPARPLFERLGATVVWDGWKVLAVRTKDRTISLRLDETAADVDGRRYELPRAPFLWRSRVMAPLRFVAENLGLTLTWDTDRQAALLSRTGPETAPGAGSGEGPPVRDVTLAFGGDTLLGFRIGEIIRDRGVDYPWEGVTAILDGADLAMVNLECAVSTRGSPQAKLWTFRAEPSALAGLKKAGVDIVSLANNHVLDFGREAFVDTLTHLDSYGVARVGAGLNAEEAARPVILEAQGFKIGFLAATEFYPEAWLATETRPGICSARDAGRLTAAVEALRPLVDYVVVSLHWGLEYDSHPYPYQRQLGRGLIDAGASLVIGHHPHVLQGFETHRDGLIVYSLGNFVFTYKTRESQDSGILLATFDEAGLAAVRFLPVFTGYGRPELESGEDRRRILDNIVVWSDELGTFVDPAGNVMLP